jgi:NADP-dependent 3-hydroxy acid dehydrogenase YdfG
MLRADDVALIALFLATLPPHIVLDEIMLLPRDLAMEPWN